MKSANKKMHKKGLIDLIALNNEIPRSRADEAIEMVLSGISDAVAKGNDITLIGFGTFYIAKTKARTGRNPMTGAPLKIKAATHVRFRAADALKKLVQS